MGQQCLEHILSKWVHDTVYHDVKLKQCFKVIKTILNICVDWHKPFTFTARDIRLASNKKISNSIAHTVINDLLSINHTEINHDLIAPEDNLERSIYSRPLIKYQDRYIFMNPSLCGHGIIHAFFDIMRNYLIGKNIYFDRVVGKHVESMVIDKLKANGLTPVFGNYTYNKELQECDMIIEGSDTIAFFEIKKRVLSFNSLSGKPLDILFDLSKSLIQSIRQALNHEVVLRKNGRIELASPNGTYNIIFNNRRVVIVSVSLLDFGSLSYHPCSRHILQSYYHHGFEFTDDSTDAEKTEYRAKLEGTNKEGEKLRNIYNELLSIENTYSRSPLFSHCLFLSIPQLFTILEECKSNDDLLKRVIRCMSVVSSSMDFYVDHDHFGKIYQKTE